MKDANDRMPEEIKKWLEPCKEANCSACFNEYNCKREADALAYIQQLERKFDAALSDLQKADVDCEFCLHGNRVNSDCREADFICSECNHKCACAPCDDGSCWEWIGLREDPPEDKQK